MSEIYKIGYNKNNKIEKVFVFIGNASEPAAAAPDTVYVNEWIHLDDSIDAIHKKIVTAWNKVSPDTISMDEIYTYFKQSERLTTDDIYEKLSDNGTHAIKNEILKPYLINIDIDAILENKDFYEYDDILELNLEKQQSYDVAVPLGQQNYVGLVTVPFNAKAVNTVVNPAFSVKQTRNQLLLNAILADKGIKDNTIYFCLAEDVLEHSNKEKIEEDDIIKLYYPTLYNKNVKSKNKLIIEHDKLIKETNAELDSRVWKENNKNVNFFYDVYDKRQSDIQYSNKGISEIYLTLHQHTSFNLPLDIVFKLIHADANVPLIKYNPSLRQEKVYRLYTNKIAKNGKKIPYLKKSVIIKKMKEIGMKPCVALYIEYKMTQNQTQSIVCEFERNGDIGIRIQFIEPIAERELDAFIYDTTEKYISTVANYLSKSGYTMNGFTSIYSANVEINRMNYSVAYPLKKNITIQNIKQCLSSIFAISGTDSKKVSKDVSAVMRLKRVANFNDMESQDAYIMDMLSQRETKESILNGLIENYKLDKEQAKKKMIDLVRYIQISEEAFGGPAKMVIKNPGFLTYIERKQISDDVFIILSVNGINHINYLKTVPIYLDTLLRITQMPETNMSDLENDCIKTVAKKTKTKVAAPAASLALATASLVPASLAKEPAAVSVAPAASLATASPAASLVPASLVPASLAADKVIEEESDEDEYDEEKQALLLQMLNTGQEEEEEGEEEEEEGEEEFIQEIPSDEKTDTVDDKNKENEEEQEEEFIQEVSDDIESKSASDKKQQEEKVKEDDKVKEEDDKVKEDDNEDEDEEYDEEKQALLLQMMNMGNDEEEADDEEESSKYGGINSDDDIEEEDVEEEEQEKDGKEYKLSHQSYFYERLQNREPDLFLSKKVGNFPSYSTSCQWNRRRQPVILTNEEKKKIDEEHKGSYDTALTYKSSDKGKTYHYICPRYWSFKDGVSLTEEEAKSGKYGAIIPRNAKKIDKSKNENVFEFATDTYGYKKQYPGFMKKTTPDNKFVPCCFDKLDTKLQKERRSMSEIVEEDTEADAEAEADEDDKKTKKKEKMPQLIQEKKKKGFDDYIKSSEKMPLEQGRYGYLPLSIQKFLHIDNQKCQVSISDKSIKKNYPCMLRYGVENSDTQSFISCIGDIIYSDKGKRVSLSDMKNILIKAITIDVFISAQNGNLIDIFSTSEEQAYAEANSQKLADDYNNSIILKNMTEGKQLLLKNKIIHSYKNFLNFLRDDKVVIDYKYLWDIVCTPNPLLFVNGINIIILQLKDDDVTDSVEMICHSKYVSFNTNRRIAILLKKGNLYEPIYMYEDKDVKTVTTKLFNLKNWRMPPNLKTSLDNIFYMLKQCEPLPSRPSYYTFIKNIKLSFLIPILKSIKMEILKQVINYNARVIGVIVNYNDKPFFIPCNASGITIDYEYIWMDDLFKDDYLNDYEETVAFLNYMYKKTNNIVKCRPAIKIIEDKLIVGVVTIANQFVPVKPVENRFKDGIREKSNVNYMTADMNIISDKVDNDRAIYVKKINLENEFYNVFRNTIHVVLGEFKNRKKREEIERIIYSQTKLYISKMKEVELAIRELTQDLFIFENYSDETLLKMNDVTNCYNANTVCKNEIYCRYNEEKDVCSLRIPKKNLINEKDNEIIYYGRITDEIIRYNRIRSFMFQPKSFIAFTELPYKLNNDEVILLQSLITEDENNYFEDMEPETSNVYVKYNTYETTQPRAGEQQRSNVYDFEKRIEGEGEEIKCETKEVDMYGKWKIHFKNCKELTYRNSDSLCSFTFVMDLIKAIHPNMKITIADIKNTLLNAYTKTYEKYMARIIAILHNEGKQNITNQISKGQVSFEYMVMSDDYFVTNLDIWVLAEHYKLPIVFLANKVLTLSENNSELLCIYSEAGAAAENYMFIKPPTFNRNINVNYDIIPQYKLIVRKDDNSKSIKAESLRDKIRMNQMTLKQYLANEVVAQKANEVVAQKANEVAQKANEVVAQKANEVAQKADDNVAPITQENKQEENKPQKVVRKIIKKKVSFDNK